MDDVRLEIFNLANIFLAGIDGTIIPFYDNNINNDINNIYNNNNNYNIYFHLLS